MPARLLDLFLIREGDVYNQRLFEESIAKLNGSGFLEPLDKRQTLISRRMKNKPSSRRH